MLRRLYDWTMALAAGRHAEKALAGVSFAESSFFPIPPDLLLVPMVLAERTRALRYAFVCTAASVLGGIAGYLIGAFLFDLAEPLIVDWGYQSRFETVIAWFDDWGFWAVLVAGFSPVPYKIFTIAAGVLNLAVVPFLLASIIGRGARFFLVAWCLARFGPAIESRLMRYIEIVGWAVVAALLLAIVIYSF